MSSNQQPITIKLRDKQKVFSKLFINSTYTPVQDQGKLIVQPTFINLIIKQLQQLKQHKSNRFQLQTYKKQIILQLLQLIKAKPQNIILMYSHDRDQQQTVFDTIIMQMVRLTETIQDIHLFQSYVPWLMSYYFVNVKNVTQLTQYLSKTFHQGKFNVIKFKFIIKLIRVYHLQGNNNNKQQLEQQKICSNKQIPLSLKNNNNNNKQPLKPTTKYSPTNNNNSNLFDKRVPFFYCYGQSCTGIRTLIKPINQHFNQPIKNQFSFSLCFHITQPHVLQRDKPPELLRFLTNKQQITVQIINRRIVVTNENTQHSITYSMSQIYCNKTYRLVLSFTPLITQLTINAQIHTLQPLIKKVSQQRVFQWVVFGQGFEGMLFSLMMFNKKVEVERQFPYQLYPYGVDRWGTLNRLKTKTTTSNNNSSISNKDSSNNNTTINKLLSKVVFAYFPFSLFSNRYKTYCFDIFRKMQNSRLTNGQCHCGQQLDHQQQQQQQQQCAGVIGWDVTDSAVVLLGEQFIFVIKHVGFYHHYEQQENNGLLDQLLLLLEAVVKNCNMKHYQQLLSSSQNHSSNYSSSSQQGNEQHFNKDTFLMLGNLISYLPQFHTPQTFHILLNLFFNFNDQQKLYFINHILWSINIPSTTNNQQTIKSYYLLMIKIYQNNKSIILQAKTITDVVYWVVHHFQKKKVVNVLIQHQIKTKILLKNIVDLCDISGINKNKMLSHCDNHFTDNNNSSSHIYTTTNINSQTVFYCCLQHYLNESVLYSDFNIQTAQQMTLKHHNLHYSWLEKILSILLEYHFIINLSQAQQSIHTLLRFLMKKYSTCFYLFIIRAIKRQLKNIFSSQKNINDNRQFIQSLHQKHHILTYLQFLSEKTISLDLITEIIHFHLFFYQSTHLNNKNKLEIISFIVKTIKRLTDLYNTPNPVKIGAKKIRKLSDQLHIKQVRLLKKQTQNQINKNVVKSSKQSIKNLSFTNNKQRQQVLSSRPMAFSQYLPLFYLIQNYLTGQISQQFIADNLSIKFKSEESFQLFKIYYQSLPKKSIFRLKLLRSIEKYVNASPSNKIFLMKNKHFLETIIGELTIMKYSINKSTAQNEIKECMQRMLTEFFQTFVKSNQHSQFQIDLRSFFKTLKSVSKEKILPPGGSSSKIIQEPKSEIIFQLNHDRFITVIQMIKRYLGLISQQQLTEFHTYNFVTQFTLILIEQVYILGLRNSNHQQNHTQSIATCMNLLNKIIQSCITKIFNPVINKFTAILSQDVTEQIYQQKSNSIIYNQLQLSQLSYIVLKKYYQFFEKQNKTKSGKLLKHIPMPSQSHSKFIQSSTLFSLFDIQLSSVNQGEINFVFDIIIPKLTSHFWLMYGQGLNKKEDQQKVQIQKNVLLKDIIEKYFNKSTVKIVYVFQIILDYMLSDINSSLKKINIKMEEINFDKNQQKGNCDKNKNAEHERISITLNKMIMLYNLLAVETVFQPQLKQDSLMNDKTSLLKMVTYLISGFLLQKIELFSTKNSTESKELFDIFNQTYTKLWMNIFEFLYFFIKEIEDSQEKMSQIQTYEQLLRKKDNKSAISMFYMDLIRFSLLDRKSNEIITFQQIKQFYLTINNKDTQSKQKLITKIINTEQFKQSITLNKQIPLILNKLSQINLKSLQNKPKNSFKNINTNSNQITSSNTIIWSHNSISSINSQKIINKQPISQYKSNNQNTQTSNDTNKIDMQKILEKQSILEEDMRAVYFFNQQLQVRRFHKIWEKLWKKMRLYHHPYGLWMAMRNDSHNFQYKHTQNQIKNFTFKISKFSSTSGLKPILQARIIQPWHIIKTKLLQNKQEIAYLNDMIQNAVESSISRKRADNSSQNGQKLNMLNIWNYMWKIPANYYMGKSSSLSTTKSKSRVFNTIWIKGNIKAQGRLSLNNNNQIQFWFNGVRQEDSHLTFQKFTLPFNKELFKKWPIFMIKKISQRRYLMKYHALEFQFIDSLFVLMYFVDNDEKEFLQLIENLRQQKILALGSKIKANNVEIFQPGWYSPAFDGNQLFQLTEKWRLNQISNLSYLIKLNILASRSGLDLSQYPVLPWIASITNHKQPMMRDLTKTLGALGSQERVLSLKEKFNSKDPFNPVPAFHYGTHYSSPGVVFNFLIRVSPFTEYLKSLQGGRFDLPDRLFSSVISSWKSAFNEISDVRELVPQFYYLPEMLINLQSHNFGFTQSLQRINHVDLPLWTAQNPYYFIIQFRQMLESCQASEKISEWIDLIFGYKQRGEQAQKSMNVYYYLTYEEYNDFDDQQDEVYKKSCEAQIVHFGQVPPQLFEKQHPKRMSLKKQLMEVKLIGKYLLMNKLNEPPAGVHLQEDKKSLTIIKRNIIEHYSLQKNPISLLKANKFNLQRSSSQLFYLWRKDTAKTVFFNTRPYFISVGYVNHQLRIYNKIHGKLQKQEILQSKIHYVHLNQEENLVIVGCQDGLLIIYELQYESNNSKLNLQKVHEQVFPHSINHISQRDGWTVVSFGSYCSVYKISRSLHYLSTNRQHYRPCVEFIRSLKNPLKVISAYIITSPLYSLILVDNAGLKSYSINGQFIKALSCNPKSELFLLKDNQMNEFIYFLQDQRIVVMSTPDLRSVSQMEVGVKCLGLWTDGLLIFDEWIGKVGW